MKQEKYNPRFYTFLEEKNLKAEELPAGLLDLIQKFEAVLSLTEKNPAETADYLNILAKTDAVISAQILNLTAAIPGKVDIDKLKLLALKAKALKLKMKLTK
ncbi:MAG: hypothetical protein ACXVNM_08565 [Bacteroidia bacterium]